MRELNLQNITLMAVVVSWFIQVGGQLFALIAVDSVIVAAPPRSFAMLAGEYRYNSGPFWDIVPLTTTVLLFVALIANWKTPRRKLMLFTFGLFIGIALVSMLYLEPTFDAIKAIGFRDEVDPALRTRAQTWHTTEWFVWAATLLGGITLLFALIRPPHPNGEGS